METGSLYPWKFVPKLCKNTSSQCVMTHELTQCPTDKIQEERPKQNTDFNILIVLWEVPFIRWKAITQDIYGHCLVLWWTPYQNSSHLKELNEELATWNQKWTDSQSVRNATFGSVFENRTRNTQWSHHCGGLCDNSIKQAWAFLNEKAPFKVWTWEGMIL